MFTSTTQSPVLLIGSAHVVDLRADLRRVLSDRTLDAVAVELDAERAQAVLSPEPPDPSGRVEVPILLRIWARLQRRLGEQMGGGLPGSEMRAAAEIARERHLPLLLIDDPIRETLGKMLRAMSFRERISLVFGGFVGLIIPTRFVERQLDEYNSAPEPYLEQIRAAYPSVARVLLDERNEHMANRLADARQKGYGRVVAVVGDAHVPGLAAALERRGVLVERISLRELQATPSPTAR